MMKQRKNVFLDAGGVILNEESHERERAEIISDVLSRFVPSFNIDHYWTLIDEAVSKFVPSVYDYVIFSRLPTLEKFEEAKESYLTIWNKRRPELVLSEGLEMVLEHLSQMHNIGILGQYGNELIGILDSHNLLKYFRFRDTQERFSMTKPDPRYFERILASAGVSAADSIMIGDRIDKDTIPAKQIGMSTIHVKTGLHRNQMPRTPDEIPDIEVDSITEVISHI